MKWYVSEYKLQNNGKFLGMATHGPFDTREQADQAHTENGCDGALTIGPDDLGPDWKSNIEKWVKGELA